MKKAFLLLAIVALGLSASAQKFSFTYEGTTYTGGETISVCLPGDGWESVFEGQLKNLTNDTVTTRVRVDDISNPEAIGISVCLGQCVPRNISSPVEIPANSTYSGVCSVHFLYAMGDAPATHGVFLMNVFDTENEGDTLQLTIDWTLQSSNAIAEAEQSARVVAYPNPSNGQVTIDCAEQGVLVVRDVLGRQVVRQAACGSLSLQLAKGIYTYGLEGQTAKKLIVK